MIVAIALPRIPASGRSSPIPGDLIAYGRYMAGNAGPLQRFCTPTKAAIRRWRFRSGTTAPSTST